MLKILHQYSIILLVLLLTGCSASWRYPNPPPGKTVKGIAIGSIGGTVIGSATTVGAPLGAVVGGVTGGAIGHHLSKHETLIEKITANHVRIILVGDNLRIILPSDLFFAPNTPVLNEHFYSVLNQIAKLLRGLNKYVVVVTGYTDNIGWPPRNVALSRQQAQAIANYLWNQGIDTRLLYATGMGEAMPIADNSTATGRRMNRRVEITLREITDNREQ